MTKYNQSWAQVNQAAEKKLELIPLLLVVIAVLIIISLQLIQKIQNCGGV